MERLKSCGNCGHFAASEIMLPGGFCAAQGAKMCKSTDEACVKWARDWRGLGPGGTDGGESGAGSRDLRVNG